MAIKVEGLVRAAPEKVFAFLADATNWPQWQDDMKAVDAVSGTPGKAGAVYHYQAKAMGKTFDSTLKVVTAANGRVAFEGEWQGGMRPRGSYSIVPATGGTLVTLAPEPECRGAMRFMFPLAKGMIRKLQRRHLEGLRRALEKRVAPEDA